MVKTLIGYLGIQAYELKIISLTLEKLLRNLPRLGDYTMGNHHEHRKTSFKYHKVRLGPPALRGLTKVDLCTSLLSGAPGPGRLPCLVTRQQLLSARDSAVRGKDSQRIRTGGSN